MFYVYILYSAESNIYYKGYTTNLEKRFEQHNSDKSTYTASKGIWKIVYFKAYETKREALIEEKRLKKLNRKSLERLLGQNYNTHLSSRL
ncbi:MAG TPA: GIY-YIG nuclease family protein [Flavobacterium sp.]|uniref:GIY-YIG nuclease family protein n=1 Tax=Flavobacterium sp. TaxID=239 RepID=UPI002C7297C1|nr:GIY-YIG nuclease family protein [Flavobacterium sp.]HSD14458.1 GIY-YIG nuclease family protein [Flavobacterium sp.]